MLSANVVWTNNAAETFRRHLGPWEGAPETLESVGKAGPNNAVMGLEDGGSYRVAGRGIDGLDGAEP